MVLKLDPRYPLVWRSPTDLQFGVDRAVVVLTDVSPPQERVIAALLRGVSRSGLDMIAADAELPDLDSLLDALGPALVAVTQPRAVTVVVEGEGPTADLVRARLSEAGIRCSTTTTTTITNDRPELAVMIAHHVLSPEQHGRWLRRDVPHLPVLFGDQVVHLGPVIEPGTGACLHCLNRHRTDADPAWPAIASQLWGRPSATETAVMAGEIAALAVRVVLRRLDGIASPDEITVDAMSGERRSHQWWQHPGCGCAGLPDLAPSESATTAARQESGSACAPPRDPIPIAPRRGGDAVARA